MLPYRRALLVLAFVAPLLSMACSSSDDETYTAVERRARQADSFFTDCVAAATDVERFDCLRQATAGEATQTCIAGFSGSAGR